MKNLSNILAFVFAFFTLNVIGQDNFYQQAFEKANNYYSAGKYDSALTYYQEIERAGLASFELYFNIGNAAFKSNNLPLAILNYERANKIKSNDKDLKYNLSLANDQITDKIDPIPPFFVSQWVTSIANQFKASIWAVINISMLILLLLFLGIYLRITSSGSKILAFYGALISLLLFTVSLGFGIKRYNFETSPNSGIVFQPSLTVKSEPSENSTDLFLLHEGTKITVLEATEGWSKISLPDGNIGWVKSSSFEII